MEIFIALMLVVSLLFYAIFAGADLGAGMIEIFPSKKFRNEERELITKAMGPVWEANHIWLILAVVILFNGFPNAFTYMSTYYHLPLTFLLIGLIFRGISFTVRHYDGLKDKFQDIYTYFFSYSSLWTTFWLGVTLGGIIVGNPKGTSFYEAYIHPWNNLFSYGLGLFLCALFVYLSCIFLISETTNKYLIERYKQNSIISNIFAVLATILMVIGEKLEPSGFYLEFIQDGIAMLFVALSVFMVFPHWVTIKNGKKTTMRVIGVYQVILIVGAFAHIRYPILIGPYDVFNSGATSATLTQLTYALIFGVLIILPALFYLLKVFKK